MNVPPFNNSFYVQVHDLAQSLFDLSNNPLPLKDFTGDEREAVGCIEECLHQFKIPPDKKLEFVSGEIKHEWDLVRISNWVVSVEKTYKDQYSSKKATNIFYRFLYWIQRWRMERVAASVKNLINNLKEREVPFAFSIKPETTWQYKEESISFDDNCFPENTILRHTQVAILPKELRRIFRTNDFTNGLHLLFQGIIFTCYPKDLDFSLTFSSASLVDKKLEAYTNRQATAIHPKDFVVKEVTLEVMENGSPLTSQKEYKEEILKRLANRCLHAKGCCVDLWAENEEDLSLKFRVIKLIDQRDRNVSSGFLTSSSKIKLFFAQMSSSWFEDKIMRKTDQATFTFKVYKEKPKTEQDELLKRIESLEECLLGEIQKSKKCEYSEEELTRIFRDSFNEKFLPINLVYNVKKEEKPPVNMRLIEVVVEEKTYKAKDFLSSKEGMDYTSIRRFVLDSQSTIKFQNGSPDQITLLPPDIIPKDHWKEKTFDQYLEEEGVIGLPKDLEENLAPFLYGRGILSDFIRKRNLEVSRGIILYGHPGTGKTLFTTKLGTYLGVPESRQKMISATEVIDKWIGSSEQNIRALFEPSKKAYEELGEKSPLYLVCIDEIDAILGDRKQIGVSGEYRRQIVGQFLSCLDGYVKQTNLLLIGTTNDLQYLDGAILRPGRFGVQIEIPLPNEENRKKMFEFYLKPLMEAKAILNEDFDVNQLAQQTEGFSGADIKGIVQDANRGTLSYVVQEIRKNSEWSMEELEKQSESCITQKALLLAIDRMRTAKKTSQKKTSQSMLIRM